MLAVEILESRVQDKIEFTLSQVFLFYAFKNKITQHTPLGILFFLLSFRT